MSDQQLRRIYQQIDLLTGMLADAEGAELAGLRRELVDLHTRAAEREEGASGVAGDSKAASPTSRPAANLAEATKPTNDRDVTEPAADWERVPDLSPDEAREVFNRAHIVLDDVLGAAADLADIHPECWGDGRREFFEAFANSMLAHSMLAYDEALSCGATERSLPYLQLLFGLRPALENAGRAWLDIAGGPDGASPLRDLSAMAAPIQAVIGQRVPAHSFVTAQKRIYPDYPDDHPAAGMPDRLPETATQADNRTHLTDGSFGGMPRPPQGSPAVAASPSPTVIPSQRRTSGFAASVLVIGILSLFAYEVGLFVFVALGLNILSLVVYRPEEQTGQWMAVVGFLFSGGALLLHLDYYGHI